MRLPGIFFLIIFILLLYSCRQEQNTGNRNNYAFREENFRSASTVKQIFYSMDMPDEMSRLFKRVGANYDPSILNSPDNFPRYDDPVEIALNMGIYGVDMSYAHLFDQTALSARYLGSLKVLAADLDLPENFMHDLFRNKNESFMNGDSLADFASEIFEKTDVYLKNNGFDAQAALIVAGGWIEALYIATRIYQNNPANIEIMARITEQKYSLNSLISLLSNYQENIRITEYVLMLKSLRKVYNEFEIYYNDLELDTINKYISAPRYETDVSPGLINRISLKVADIRTEMVN